MNKSEIIDQTMAYIKARLLHAEGGHDWWHIERVWKNAGIIAKTESADMFIVELGALLHDIADYKFHGVNESAEVAKACKFLENLGVDTTVIDHVANIILHVSFKGGNFTRGFYSTELAVVQDADRLDAMGAIGIARTFNYGGFRGREIYNPGIAPDTGMNIEQYQKSTSPTINHFYEKLLLLKDRMNTLTGRQMAERRHRFMEQYLEEFFRDLEG